MATNFRVVVKFNNKDFNVNVTRTSTGIQPNSYFAKIVNASNVLNEFPTVVYNSVNGELFCEQDTLINIFSGFADVQKSEIMKYLELNNIEV